MAVGAVSAISGSSRQIIWKASGPVSNRVRPESGWLGHIIAVSDRVVGVLHSCGVAQRDGADLAGPIHPQPLSGSGSAECPCLEERVTPTVLEYGAICQHGVSDSERVRAGLESERMSMDVNDAVARILKTEGVEWVSCFPSNNLIESVASEGIRTIMFRQERGALMAADGYSRMNDRNRFGVAITQGGPGSENSHGGIAQAFSDNIPILYLGRAARPWASTPSGPTSRRCAPTSQCPSTPRSSPRRARWRR